MVNIEPCSHVTRVILTNEVRECGTITLTLRTGALGLCSSLKATRTKQELGRSALVKDERVWKTSLGVADRSHSTTVMIGDQALGTDTISEQRAEQDDGGKREQGHSDRQFGRRSGNPSYSGRPANCQSAARDFGFLARQGNRGASREDRMAPRCDLQ